MFNLGRNSKVRGSGHLILNVLRALTIIGLVAIMGSSWAMIVLSGLTGKFFFFDTISHFFVFLFAVFLTITEVNLFQRYFSDNWPVFSVSHSLAWLGVLMIVLGCQVLGNLDKDKYSRENLTLPIWRLVLASGILAITFGFINIVASIIFRDGNQGITARHIRKDGSLATADNKATMYDNYSARDAYSRDGAHSQPAASYHQEREEVSAFRRATRMMNPMNLPKNLNFRKSKIQPHSEKPVISKPILAQEPDIERGRDSDDIPMVQDDRRSPIVPAVQRPPTALHPMHTGVSSVYSVAHHIDRFGDDRDRTYNKDYL
ncbi:hypothetical protein NKR19_g566 [Coniochaeta hoffmannii]|uniref:DUF7598 domain-containing protein n=1 Tax=Coniochaeta hoffmannii TaxID=91930 RepID=A0AA38S8U5_9PEZI|nr:hypothetical protein NKR19_g566 [Coniochaeta hoffmannii]